MADVVKQLYNLAFCRNNNNDSINNNHSPPPRGVSPSSKSSPAAYLALNALAAAAANSNGLALIGSRVPSDDISSSGESSVGSGCRHGRDSLLLLAFSPSLGNNFSKNFDGYGVKCGVNMTVTAMRQSTTGHRRPPR